MSKRPNIIFIMSDQHTWDVMGNEGDKYVRTPNLDKLAAMGTKFTNCYCASPLCVPGRSAHMSGKLPMQNRVFNNSQSLHSDIITYAHSANIAGYETVLSGRMHFFGPDQNHGFEKRLVGDMTNLYPGPPNKALKERFGSLIKCALQDREGLSRAGSGDCVTLHFDRAVTQAAIDHMENREDDRPLLMTIGWFSPHPPFVAEKEKYDYYKEILPDPETHPEFRENLHPAMLDWLVSRNVDDVPMEWWRNARAAYYANVEFTDEQVGLLMDAIDKNLGLDNTVIIYSSDHGESMGRNGFPWKTNFYEAPAKVPMIVSYPPEYQNGAVYNENISQLDLAHTMVSIADAPAIPNGYGIDISGVLKGEETLDPQRPIIAQLGTYPPKTDKPGCMVKKGKYKLIKYVSYDLPILFDLEADPQEAINLAAKPEYADVVKELSADMDEVWDGDWALDYCNRSFDDYKILVQWSNETKFPMPKNFEIDGSKVNYLDSEM